MKEFKDWYLWIFRSMSMTKWSSPWVSIKLLFYGIKCISHSVPVSGNIRSKILVETLFGVDTTSKDLLLAVYHSVGNLRYWNSSSSLWRVIPRHVAVLHKAFLKTEVSTEKFAWKPKTIVFCCCFSTQGPTNEEKRLVDSTYVNKRTDSLSLHENLLTQYPMLINDEKEYIVRYLLFSWWTVCLSSGH